MADTQNKLNLNATSPVELKVDDNNLAVSLNIDDLIAELFGENGFLISYGEGIPNENTTGKIYLQLDPLN